MLTVYDSKLRRKSVNGKIVLHRVRQLAAVLFGSFPVCLDKLADFVNSFVVNDKSIEQAKTKLNSSDITNEERNQCRYQIEYLKINSFELQRSKYYYETQNKLSELYEEYSEKIVQEQKNRLKYETYQKLCEIKVYESQNDYLKVFAEYKKNSLDVINKSFEIGYATENGVLSAKRNTRLQSWSFQPVQIAVMI